MPFSLSGSTYPSPSTVEQGVGINLVALDHHLNHYGRLYPGVLTIILPPSRHRWLSCKRLVAVERWSRKSGWTWLAGSWRRVIRELGSRSGRARSWPRRRWQACSTERRWWSSSTKTLAWRLAPPSDNCIRLKQERKNNRFQIGIFNWQCHVSKIVIT